MKLALYLLALLTASLAARAQTPRVAAPPPDDQTLEFVANGGQWPAAVRYGAAVPGGHLYLEPAGLHYVLLEGLPHPHGKADGHRAGADRPAGRAIRGHQLRVRFAGARPEAALQPAQATGGVRNYLHGNDPAAWARAVPGYRQVRYQQPWPGIDVRFYENDTRHLEYDFELAPGADPARVQLRYEGATRLRISPADGQLHVGTSLGELTELHPRAYQPAAEGGAPTPVSCAYRLDAATNTVSFALGRYDHSRPLVIDPVVVFSSYSGATSSNWGFTATYDNAGNIYSGGIVLDDGFALPSFPTTPGAFQTTFAALVDMALIKYNPAANGPAARLWATYVGGDRADIPSSLVVNAQNELVVLGSSSSTNYPISRGCVQRSFGGGTYVAPFGDAGRPYDIPEGTDIVVSRLSADGGAMLASTYLGGAANDGVLPYVPTSSARQLPQNYGDPLRGDVQTDAQGNIYIASVTASTNFPRAGASFNSSFRGGTCDAVVAKLTPDLSALTWGGLLGGGGADAAYSLQLDGSGAVYAAGGTLSTNLPVTAGAYQGSLQGSVDGFVARIAADGRSIEKATYLGTSDYDQAFFVQQGSDGGVYVLGQSLGSWPVSGGVYSNPGSHQFIQKLGHDLNSSLLSTVFGSGRATIDISPTAFLVDQCDRVYACGWGGLLNGPGNPVYSYSGFVERNGYTHGMATTANAVRRTPDSPTAGSDFYLAQFGAGLANLVYGTFYGDATPSLGEDHVDGGTSRFDPRGVVYAAACACFTTNGFPVPPGANTYSTINGTAGGSFCNNAAFKINFEPNSASVGNTQTVCVTSPAFALTTGTPAGGIWSGPGVTGSVATGFVFTPSQALLGPQTLTYLVPGTSAACSATATLLVTVQTPQPAAVPALPTVCAGTAAVRLAGTPAGGTWSGPGVSGSAATGFVFTPSQALVGTQTLTYAIAASSACGSAASQASTTITVLAVPAVTVPADTVLCPGATPTIRLRGNPAGGVWTVPGGSSGSTTFTPPAGPGSYLLTYTVGAGTPCPVSATRRVTVLAAPQLSPALVPGPCAASLVAPYGVIFQQDTTTLPTGAVVSWNFGDGTPPQRGGRVTHVYQAAGTFQPSVQVSFNNARCTQAVSLTPITVQDMLIPNIVTANSGTPNATFLPRVGGCPPRLQIFSRWGRLVYEDAAYQGTWSGSGLAAGTYYYLLTPADGLSAPLKGWVEVVK